MSRNHFRTVQAGKKPLSGLNLPFQQDVGLTCSEVNLNISRLSADDGARQRVASGHSECSNCSGWT